MASSQKAAALRVDGSVYSQVREEPKMEAEEATDFQHDTQHWRRIEIDPLLVQQGLFSLEELDMGASNIHFMSTQPNESTSHQVEAQMGLSNA